MQLIWTDRAYLTIAIIGYIIVIATCCFLFYKRQHEKKWNANEPFIFVALFLMIGEWIFKSFFCLMQNWDSSYLPFEICGLWLIFAAMALFTKKNSPMYRLGYTLVYTISLFVSIIETIIPSAIYSANGNGSIFANYLAFWGVFYHMGLFFCCIWLAITRPYKLRHRDIFYGAAFGVAVLALVALLGWGIDTNFAEIRYGQQIKIPGLEKLSGTFLYAFLKTLMYGILVIIDGYIWKYAIDQWLPKYCPKINKWCKKYVYKPTWKFIKKSIVKPIKKLLN